MEVFPQENMKYLCHFRSVILQIICTFKKIVRCSMRSARRVQHVGVIPLLFVAEWLPVTVFDQCLIADYTHDRQIPCAEFEQVPRAVAPLAPDNSVWKVSLNLANRPRKSRGSSFYASREAIICANNLYGGVPREECDKSIGPLLWFVGDGSLLIQVELEFLVFLQTAFPLTQTSD